MKKPLIIIGAGLAAYQLAKEFRRLDSESPMLVITADNGNYYSKPLLSTAFTAGKTATHLTAFSKEAMAKQLNATILSQTFVTQLNTAEKILTANHEVIEYSQCVLACGADAIKAPLTGDGACDVISVNHIDDYAQFQENVRDKKRLAILGAGLIGCEFANDLSNIGLEVHVIAPVTRPLNTLLPDQVSTLLQDALSAQGVIWHLPNTVSSVEKMAGQYRLTFNDKTQLSVDAVLSAIGLVPHIKLATYSGLETKRGICVNRYLETSAPDVYALGDCAEVEGHVLPYITPLLNCSRALAKTLTGTRTAVAYPAMPIMIKTPSYPLVVCPPPRDVTGSWQIETIGKGVKALFHNEKNDLIGFVLSHEATKEKGQLAATIPPFF
jgi:rubredoxin-NAD+ reductase